MEKGKQCAVCAANVKPVELVNAQHFPLKRAFDEILRWSKRTSSTYFKLFSFICSSGRSRGRGCLKDLIHFGANPQQRGMKTPEV